MNYKKLNNLGGWLVFLISLIVYTLTVEPTASYWDCGEFISVSYRLQTPHPPGVPVYILIARLFSLIAADKEQIAFWVNMVSVVSSAFTILFMFWTISFIGRKILKIANSIEPTMVQTFLILSASTVGALSFTFSDSFWFNAGEAEVYAMSMFFSAFVYWSMLKWESVADEEGADKWLLLTAYMIGLSLGVHILNLVMIPGLALIYYFKKFKPTVLGGIAALLISIVGLGVVLELMYYGFATVSKWLDFWLVNSFDMAVNSGIYLFLFILIVAFVGGIFYSIKAQKYYLNLSILSFFFIVLGYLSYAEIVIRSNANPPIDENDPENAYNLEKYLRRDQYGSVPLLSGPQFGFQFQNIDDPYGLDGLGREARNAKIESWKKPLYMVKDGKWKIYDYKLSPEYSKKVKSFLPRMPHAQERNIAVYESMLEAGNGDVNINDAKHSRELRKYGYIKGYYRRGDYKKTGWVPTFGQNISYMFQRQIGTMYLRYFGWNFVGRDGDLQFSGVRYPFDSDVKPDVLSSKAENNFYAIPLILGVLGLFFLFMKSENDFWVSLCLFLFTGLAIIAYLNAPAVEPRERDYAYAGSYYIFAIWIGLGVMFIADALQQFVKNQKAAVAIALIVSLTAPVLMATQGWDDHDRSKRWYSVESAVNMLESCAPNAILFTGGDNDTFPLWFAQEVLEVRQDVRVCNTSLLGTDWYITQMKRKAYESAPLPIGFEKELYQEGVNDIVRYQDINGAKNQDQLISLTQYMKAAKMQHSTITSPSQTGGTNTFIPSKRLKIDLKDKNAIIANNALPEKYVKYFKNPGLNQIQLNIKANAIMKQNLMVLEMISEISKTNWDRPIYFGSLHGTATDLGLTSFLVNEGMAYRFIPFDQGANWNEEANIPVMYENLMNKKELKWTNLDDKSIHYSDQYGSFVSQSKNKFLILATALYYDTTVADNEQKAKDVIYKCLEKMPNGPFYYDQSNLQMADLLHRLGDKEKALEIIDIIKDNAIAVVKYQNTGNNANKAQYVTSYTYLRHERHFLPACYQFYKKNGYKEQAAELETYMEQLPQ